MSQHYSNPAREHISTALPDVEVFYVSAKDFLHAKDGTWMFEEMSNAGATQAEDTDYPAIIGPELRRIASELAGWYHWPCFPGCLPDGEPTGPYATEAEAIEAAQADYLDWSEEP